jgi:hypothetical protein
LLPNSERRKLNAAALIRRRYRWSVVAHTRP